MRLTVVCVFSFCFLGTSGSSCGLPSLFPPDSSTSARQRHGPAGVSYVSLHVTRIVFGLECCRCSCWRSVFSSWAARAERTCTTRCSFPERHCVAASLWDSFLQLDDWQSNFTEISRRQFQGHTIPSDLPSGAGCYTIAISERSKCPSPCVLGDCESSLRFAGIVMY